MLKRALSFALLFFVSPSPGLLAKDNGQWEGSPPAVREWFREQTVPGTSMRCCDEADGELVREEIRGDSYWIISEHFPEWTRVPPERILQGPNKYGEPVVWRAEMNGVSFIRCYAPGAGL